MFERLEPRRMLAGWQADPIRFDVDQSGLCTPSDALKVINFLIEHGASVLDGLPQDSDYYLDVNGDGRVSPTDPLQVINAIQRNQTPLNIAMSLLAGDDPNGNGVVLRDDITVSGVTSPNARVELSVSRLDVNLEPIQPPLSINFVASSDGKLSQSVPITPGRQRIDALVIDELGRSIEVSREVIRGDVVADFNAAALNVVRDWTTLSNDPYEGRIVPSEPPKVAHHLAMIHAAMFDAINAFDPVYHAYLSNLNPPIDASPQIAGVAAAREVARSFYSQPDEVAIWDATLHEVLATMPAEFDPAASLQFGQSVGELILSAREDDGSEAVVIHQDGDRVGLWQRTPPGNLPPLLPQWPSVTPFVVEDIQSYRPAPPPTLSSEAYASALDEVMRLGALSGSERTDEQTEIATFWLDGGGSATPPGHWNRIASNVLFAEQLPLIESARSMAVLNLALADAGIAAWDAKYAYELWRPIDAIRQADLDGNPQTELDTDWLPFLQSPPFPTYTSGHSTFSGAAAAVLTELFGDNYSFASTTDSHTGHAQRPVDAEAITTRVFSSFETAAAEAGISRIYGGIHFGFDNTEGLAAGSAVGTYVSQNVLQPK